MSILFSENLINESIFIKVLLYMPHKVIIELTEKDMDTNLKTQNR